MSVWYQSPPMPASKSLHVPARREAMKVPSMSPVCNAKMAASTGIVVPDGPNPRMGVMAKSTGLVATDMTPGGVVGTK